MPESRIEIPTASKHQLAATLFVPKDKPRGAVLLASGTGIRRGYYRHFATWLTKQGFAVLTFDYRGIGDSREKPLAQNLATLWDWANLDLPAAWQILEKRFPKLPLFHIGHSMGGILAGALPPDRLTGMVMVGAGASSWYQTSFPINFAALILWRVFMPLTIALKGYFPAGWFGLGAPLPRGVARGWANLCLDRPFLKKRLAKDITSNHYAELTCPIINLAMDDDYLVNPRNQQALLDCFPKAQTSGRIIKRIDRRAVNHLGFFHPEKGKPYWPEVLAILNKCLSQSVLPTQSTTT